MIVFHLGGYHHRKGLLLAYPRVARCLFSLLQWTRFPSVTMVHVADIRRLHLEGPDLWLFGEEVGTQDEVKLQCPSSGTCGQYSWTP